MVLVMAADLTEISVSKVLKLKWNGSPELSK